MEERLCLECKKPLLDTRYKYCPVCRSLYGIEQRSDLARNKSVPPKGRDRFSERLRAEFEMIRDDDP
jgi:hypothetical protein